jgi:hypothetical protein
MKGKIQSLNYLHTHETSHVLDSDSTDDQYVVVEHVMDQQVFGFALEQNLDQSYISYQAYAQKHRNSEPVNLETYDCTEEVYSNLSPTVGEDLPKNLNVRCIRISTKRFNQGFDPTFKLMECMHNDICKPVEERNKVLKELWVWVFTLTDETDYT